MFGFQDSVILEVEGLVQLRRIVRTQEDAREVKHTEVTPRAKQEPTCLSHFHPLAPNFLPGEEQWHAHQVGKSENVHH